MHINNFCIVKSLTIIVNEISVNNVELVFWVLSLETHDSSNVLKPDLLYDWYGFLLWIRNMNCSYGNTSKGPHLVSNKKQTHSGQNQ